MNHTRILILRLSSIGDILLSTPFIRQTRIRFPEATIDFVVKKQFLELIKFNPHLNKIYEYDPQQKFKGLLSLGLELRDKKYHYVFDLHNNPRTKILSALSRHENRYKISKDKLKRFLLVKLKLNLYSEITTIPDRYLRTGKILGITDDHKSLEIYWKNETEFYINSLLKENGITSRFITLAPGAGYFTKKWPLEKYSDLITKILKDTNFYILILGSSIEQPYLSNLIKDDRILNLAGKISLSEAAAILSRSTVLVSNDSGLMHMSTAVKTPVIALFGSTVKELGFFPYLADAVALENKGLKCRPCSHLGRNKCPKKHFKCMNDITVDNVFDQIQYIENR
jgi:heptosyltransferase-2